MKKAIGIFVCILMCLSSFSLYACTGEKADNTITLAWDFNVRKPVWEKVVAEYKKVKPGVNIKLDQKDGQSYNDWLAKQLNSGKADADIVINNGVMQYFSSGKFVDFSQYLIRRNPYADNAVWQTVLENSACQPYSGGSQVVSLNNESVVTAWFYNADMFEQMGVVEFMDGLTPDKWNWDDLIKACEFIKSKGKIPLSIGGDYASFWAYQGGWLYRVYTDQYFRDMEDYALAQPGDYCYDREYQSGFKLDTADKNNDVDPGFVVNWLRVAKGVKTGEIGPNHAKYKDMVKNLSRLIPTYVPDGFLSMSNADAAKKFILGDAAIYIDLLSFNAGLERTFADYGAQSFKVGVFRYPPMTAQTDGVSVGVDYTRDPGGADGNFGIIYKNKEKADAAVDFLMYFFSAKGQEVFMSALAQENIAPNGVSLIKNVTIPEKWHGKYDMPFPGKADSNPMGAFSNGFMEVQESVREFVDQSQKYYGGKQTLDEYCNNLQTKACADNINGWLKANSYRPNSLDNVTLDPAAR